MNHICKKVIKATAVLSGVVLMAASLSMGVMASELSAFTVKAELPDNQKNDGVTYFDLMMKPGEKQIIRLEVSNNNREEITASINVHNASTGKNGNIVYSVKGICDDSMTVAAEDIATVLTPQMTLAPNSKQFAEIELSMPEEPFDGVVLGGIYITAEDESEKKPEDGADGIQIKNRLAYVVGLKISETDQAVAPNLNLVKIEPDVSAMRTALAVNLQNSEAVIMKGITIDARVLKQGAEVPIQELQITYAEAAPNSNFNVIIDWGGNKIEPGKYRLIMTADYLNDQWQWDEEFEIRDTEAKNVNEKAIEFNEGIAAESAPSMMTVYIVIGSLLLIIIILLVVLIRKNHQRNNK